MDVVSGTMALSDRSAGPHVAFRQEADAALVAAARAGDRDAVETLVRRHDRWVRHVVYATLAQPGEVDDVVQHVWTNVWQQIGPLAEPARWRGWLYKMARNAAVDAVERLARERQCRNGFQARLRVSKERGPAEAVIREEQHHRVLDAIRGLPAHYREPFVLRHLEGWSYAQIGEAMDMPIDTVETRLVRARRLLRAALQDGRQREERHERQ